MKKRYIFLWVLIGIALAGFFSLRLLERTVQPASHIKWGVDFSQMQAENLKLDWQKIYLALLRDLGARHIKLHTQWDWVEGERGKFYFTDIDWQIQQARQYNADIIYVVGMKTGRWPECHLPAWAQTLSKQEQQEEILAYIEKVVRRYRGNSAIAYWQAENEPFFKFGKCPWYDKNFLKKEIELIQSLDPLHPVIISETGEWSFWLQAAHAGDVVGTTLYRRVWYHINGMIGFYITMPLAPQHYGLRSKLIYRFFGKKVINVELQAEPWVQKPFYDIPLQDQELSMNLRQFQKNIEYAKATGLDTFYLWGVEWMYWLKEKHNKPEIWNEAKTLFKK